jgi:hypothetical protein
MSALDGLRRMRGKVRATLGVKSAACLAVAVAALMAAVPAAAQPRTDVLSLRVTRLAVLGASTAVWTSSARTALRYTANLRVTVANFGYADARQLRLDAFIAPALTWSPRRAFRPVGTWIHTGGIRAAGTRTIAVNFTITQDPTLWRLPEGVVPRVPLEARADPATTAVVPFYDPVFVFFTWLFSDVDRTAVVGCVPFRPYCYDLILAVDTRSVLESSATPSASVSYVASVSIPPGRAILTGGM